MPSKKKKSNNQIGTAGFQCRDFNLNFYDETDPDSYRVHSEKAYAFIEYLRSIDSWAGKSDKDVWNLVDSLTRNLGTTFLDDVNDANQLEQGADPEVEGQGSPGVGTTNDEKGTDKIVEGGTDTAGKVPSAWLKQAAIRIPELRGRTPWITGLNHLNNDKVRDVFDFMYEYLPELEKPWVSLTDATVGKSEDVQDTIEGQDATSLNISNMVETDTVVLSENETGMKLREGLYHAQPDHLLSDSQIITLALNEAARDHGEGKFFYLDLKEKVPQNGNSFSGADMVYVPWIWSDIDKELWDSQTPQTRITASRSTNLPSGIVVLAIYLLKDAVSADGTKLEFPVRKLKTNSAKLWQFDCASILLSFAEYCSVGWIDNFEINTVELTPSINMTDVARFRKSNRLKVLIEFADMWQNPRPSKSSSCGAYVVDIDEVYADRLSGREKADALAKVKKRRKFMVSADWENPDADGDGGED